jgi:phage/plasmid-like protein (TIGR03299 family)
LQNREAFDFTDSIIGEGLARYHTAGALDGGRRIFLSIKLDSTMRVKQDLIEKFLVCASSHDGSLATMALVTPVRVVCQNTLAQAFGNCSNKIAVRHTKAQGEKLKLAQKTLAQALGYFEKFEAMANALTSVKVDDQTFDKIVKVVMPAKDENDVPTRTVNLRNTLRHLFQGGAKGSDGHLGTGWQAYNALTEYADHHRLVKGENEVVNSRLFGTAASFKEKALTTLLSAVQLPMAA